MDRKFKPLERGDDGEVYELGPPSEEEVTQLVELLRDYYGIAVTREDALAYMTHEATPAEIREMMAEAG